MLQVELPALEQKDDDFHQWARKKAPEVYGRVIELLMLKHRKGELKESQLKCSLMDDSRVRITGSQCVMSLTQLEQLWTPFRETCTGMVIGFRERFLDVHFRPGTAVGSAQAQLTDIQRMQLGEKKQTQLSQFKDLLVKPDGSVAAVDQPRVSAVSNMILRVLGQDAPRELRVELTEKTDAVYVLTCSGMRSTHLNDLRTLVSAEKLGIADLYVSLDKGTLAVHVCKTGAGGEPTMWIDRGFYVPLTAPHGALAARRDADGRLFKRQRTDVA